MKKYMLLLLILLSVKTLADDNTAGMVYRYWDWGKTPKRDEYQLAALRLGLEKTRSEYGKFEIVRHQGSYSTSRSRREINRGTIINIHAGPWRPLEKDPAKLSERSIKVELQILNGLLGYRQLIIRKSDAEMFKNLNISKELKNLTAGQARGWQDVDIFRYNGYKVDDDANLTSLFAMLSSKRFDYLPMSVAETQSVIKGNRDYEKEFMIVPDIIIYYPFPIIFYISIHEPVMAERLRKGLFIAEKDGSLTQLFNDFFTEEIAAVKNRKLRYVVLDNPFIPEQLKQRKPVLLEN